MEDQEVFATLELHEQPLSPLVKVLVAVAVVLAVCCAYLAYAVTQQGDRIDELEAQTDRIEAETNRIGHIADAVTAEDPEQSAALQELFRKIDEICRATAGPENCEPEEG